MNANIAISGAIPATSGTMYFYGIPQDDAARTGSGSSNVSTNPGSGLAANFLATFSAFSATVIAFGASTPPPPPAVHQPDTQIKAGADASYLGDNIYNIDGTGQTRSLSIKAGGSATFDVKIQNDGTATDKVTLRGTGASGAFTVKYYTGISGGTDITSAVVAGTYAVSGLAPAASQVLRLVVTTSRKAATGTSKNFLVTAISTMMRPSRMRSKRRSA
jgi:hypothetical protein